MCVSDNTLRDLGLLNDLNENEFDSGKLNGYRISSKSKSQWRFDSDEVDRYAKKRGPMGEPRSGDGAGVEIRGI